MKIRHVFIQSGTINHLEQKTSLKIFCFFHFSLIFTYFLFLYVFSYSDFFIPFLLKFPSSTDHKFLIFYKFVYEIDSVKIKTPKFFESKMGEFTFFKINRLVSKIIWDSPSKSLDF